MPPDSVIHAECVDFRYAESEWILRDIDFTLHAGEILCIVGPSGCGKTSLLNLIAGLTEPSRGVIHFSRNGHEQRKIGYIFQFDALLPWRKVRGNLALGMEISGKKQAWDDSHISSYLDAFHLDESVLDKYPSELSGGMRQRVAIIQSLLYDPDVLLLDEPFSSLDFYTKLNLETEFWKLVKNRNKAAIFITHDIDEAIAMGDRVFIMGASPGRIIEDVPITDCAELPPEESRSHPAFSRHFNHIWGAISQQMAEKRKSEVA